MKLTAQDKDWRAENDADTLLRVEEINSDSARKKAALGKLVAKEKDIEKTLKVIKKVSKPKKPKSKPKGKSKRKK